MMVLSSLDPNQLAIIATILGVELSGNRSAGDVNVIGNFMVAVGYTMLVLASQKENLAKTAEKQQEQKDDPQQQIDELKKQIQEIKDQLNAR